MKVLFICGSNVERSQMAEAFFNKLSKKNYAISAAGVDLYYIKRYHARIANIPKEQVIQAMAEKGIDISKNRIKKINKKMAKSSDLLIALMEKEWMIKDMPEYVRQSAKFRLWEIPDVSGRLGRQAQYKAICRNRDRISALVKNLVKEIG